MISVIWIILLTPVFLYPFELNVASLATVGGFLVLLADLLPRVGPDPVPWTRPAGHAREELAAIEREFEDAAEALTA